MAAQSGLTQNCRYLIEHTGGSIAKELDNQVCWFLQHIAYCREEMREGDKGGINLERKEKEEGWQC